MTSKAGLRTAMPGTVTSAPPAWRTSSPSRSSIGIAAPSGVARSTDEVGPAGDEGDAGRRGGERQAVGPDLVGHAAVGGHAVEADHDRVGLAAGEQPGRRRVGHERERSPARSSSQAVSRAPWSSGRVSPASTSTGPSAASARITPSAVPWPEARERPVLQCV